MELVIPIHTGFCNALNLRRQHDSSLNNRFYDANCGEMLACEVLGDCVAELLTHTVEASRILY